MKLYYLLILFVIKAKANYFLSGVLWITLKTLFLNTKLLIQQYKCKVSRENTNKWSTMNLFVKFIYGTNKVFCSEEYNEYQKTRWIFNTGAWKLHLEQENCKKFEECTSSITSKIMLTNCSLWFFFPEGTKKTFSTFDSNLFTWIGTNRYLIFQRVEEISCRVFTNPHQFRYILYRVYVYAINVYWQYCHISTCLCTNELFEEVPYHDIRFALVKREHSNFGIVKQLTAFTGV